MNRKFLITGAIFGLLAVILGAFAAHGLKNLISEEAIASFETGVRFQMYHAFLLLILGFFKIDEVKLKWTYLLILFGTIFFSVSIYLLATNELSSFDFKKIALITPLGGTLLIASWAILVFKFSKLKRK